MKRLVAPLQGTVAESAKRYNYPGLSAAPLTPVSPLAGGGRPFLRVETFLQIDLTRRGARAILISSGRGAR